MSLRPSVVFLYDLDLSNSSLSAIDEPKCDKNTNHATEHSLTRLLRYVTLNILNHFTEKQVNIQWAYRFYCSSNYKHTNKAGFQDLTEHSLEEFEETLDVRYEQHTTLPPQEYESFNNCTSQAAILGRTLQDIATDFSWKAPTDSLTPTRKGKKGKQLQQNLNNLVFIFTQVPSDESIGSFCNLNNNQVLSPKAVMDCILTKDLVKKFNEFQLSLNFVDVTSSKKCLISKIATDLRGVVVSSTAFLSPFSFNQIFQAARLTEDGSAQCCESCVQLNLSRRFYLQTANTITEVDVQCWSTTCSNSSLRYFF